LPASIPAAAYLRTVACGIGQAGGTRKIRSQLAWSSVHQRWCGLLL